MNESAFGQRPLAFSVLVTNKCSITVGRKLKYFFFVSWFYVHLNEVLLSWFTFSTDRLTPVRVRRQNTNTGSTDRLETSTPDLPPPPPTVLFSTFKPPTSAVDDDDDLTSPGVGSDRPIQLRLDRQGEGGGAWLQGTQCLALQVRLKHGTQCSTPTKPQTDEQTGHRGNTTD
jgi:hypothetical protein